MSLDNVQRALLRAAKETLGPIPTRFENELFDPPSAGKWAAVFFIPNPIQVETLGKDGSDWADGLLQIDLNYPLNTGSADGRADFEAIRKALPAGTRLDEAGQAVRVRNVYRSSGRQVDGAHRVSVTVEWYALIPR